MTIKKINIEKEEISNKEKVKYIRNLNKISRQVKSFKIEDKGIFYLKKVVWKFELYNYFLEKHNLLLSIPISNEDDINLVDIFWENKIVLTTNSKSYIYNLDNWSYNDFIFKLPITYIKKGYTNNEYLFVAKKWTFIYDTLDNKFNYFNIFNDFVYFWENSYIWIISKDETNRLKNYNININSNYLILKYNLETKEKKILLQLNQSFIKIVEESNEIIVYDWSWNKYKLDNL